MAHKNQQNRSPWKDRQKKRPKDGNAPLKGKHKRPEEKFSFQEADDRIYDIFRHHEFGDFPHEQRQLLTRFYLLLMANQQQQNFTRLLKLRDVAIRHFIDSLIVGRLTELKTPLLDMGSGPGFPGVPLKIAFPELRVILAEGVQTRVEFLKQVREKLELKELDIIGRNINEEFVYPVHGVITRAVEDIGNTLGNVINCVQTGGRVYLMKGPNVDPEIEPALKKWGEYYALKDDFAYDLPNTQHHRRLLVFEKIKRRPLDDDFFEDEDEDENKNDDF